jgi:hypothetical protein
LGTTDKAHSPRECKLSHENPSTYMFNRTSKIEKALRQANRFDTRLVQECLPRKTA